MVREKVSHISQIRSSNASTSTRLGWIDAARGGGILLVVLGHVWRGLVPPGVLAQPEIFEAVDQFIYLFHMPVFFLLSGYVFLVGPWSGVLTFVTQKCARLLWPAVLWLYLFVGVNILVGAAANTQFNLSRLLSWPEFGGTYLWFLWALFLIQIAALGLKAAPMRWQPGLVLLGGVVSLWLRHSEVLAIPPTLLPALIYMPVFLSGVALYLVWGTRMIESGVSLTMGIVLGAVLFVGAQAFGGLWVVGAGMHVGLGLVAALGFVIVTTSLWAWFPHSKLMHLLCHLGRLSMAIYLVHVFFTAGVRIVLIKIGIMELAPHVMLGTAFGVGGPLIVLALARRFGVARLLGF